MESRCDKAPARAGELKRFRACLVPWGHMLPWSHWSRPHGPDERVQGITHNLLQRAGTRSDNPVSPCPRLLTRPGTGYTHRIPTTVKSATSPSSGRITES